MNPRSELLAELERHMEQLVGKMSSAAGARASERLFGPNTRLAQWFGRQQAGGGDAGKESVKSRPRERP